MSERNDFSNFESPCHCDASFQVSAQSDLGLRRRCRLKNFKMAAWRHLDIGTERFSNSECVTVMPPITVQPNQSLGGDVV